MFDIKAAYAALSAEDQAAIGELGLLMAYAHKRGVEIESQGTMARDDATRTLTGLDTAITEAIGLIVDLVPDYPDDAGIPDLTPFGVQQCRVCGCTEAHGCEAGCSWAETDLCTECVA